METIHKELAAGRWRNLSLCEQLANIGGEVSRARLWQKKDPAVFDRAVTRALELFELTLSDSRWHGRWREIARSREVFLDTVSDGTEYRDSLERLERYFNDFALCARSTSL
ncbi:MAG: hypothetical protein HYS44_02905 [Candidatus Niyogibacteria bacterium]|nr:hypothetical protein [Candidatus Niyogibacteria bacterium]